MHLSQFLRILKARWLVATLVLAITVVTTMAVSLWLPKQYTASTTLVVDAKSKDPVTGMLLPAQLIPGYLATQVDIIQSQTVALRVVRTLKLAGHPTVRADYQAATGGRGSVEHWLADLLLKKLDITPSRESSVMTLSFTGSDPEFAAVVANAFAEAYIHTNLELKVEPARLTSAWYETKLKDLRGKAEQAHARLSAYQREHGLVATDERGDVESVRLAELSQQLSMAQSQTYDVVSRQEQSTAGLPDVMNTPVVQSLRADVARAEAKLAELSEKVGHNHPQYQRAKAELDTLRAKLEGEIGTASRGVSASARVAQQRERDLRAATATQKARVLELKKRRDELAVLVNDAESAQRVYDTALQRHNQTSLEAATEQTDVSILNRAIAPLEPSSPNLLLNVAIAVFLGGLLSIGLAILMELVDRRVRSAEDLSLLLQLPVLGELGKSAPARRRLPFPRAFGRARA